MVRDRNAADHSIEHAWKVLRLLMLGELGDSAVESEAVLDKLTPVLQGSIMSLFRLNSGTATGLKLPKITSSRTFDCFSFMVRPAIIS